MNHLFISWGGDEAREIGEWLHANIFQDIPGLDIYLSPLAPAGTPWRQGISDNLKKATHGLGILTDEAQTRPWFLYEVFMLRDRLERVPLLRFCHALSDRHPLSEIQMADGFAFRSILQVAEGLLANQDPVARRHACSAIALKEAAWTEKVDKLSARKKKMQALRHAAAALHETLGDAVLYPSLDANGCIRELARKSLVDLEFTFRTLKQGSTFAVDRNRYPEYLIHLQNALKCRTLAVAVVDQVEEFWAQQTGAEILKHTHPDSKRIFIFENAEVLHRYFDQLSQHRRTYDVSVMSKRDFKIAADRFKIDGDYSILTDPATEDAVTAYYTNATQNIEFTADPGLLTHHRRAFAELRSRAHTFPLLQGPLNKQQNKEFAAKVFARQPGLYHSDVIPIERYDAFEEDHPFYRDMLRRMLEELHAHVGSFRDSDKPIPILEIGAGTGHFTKRLTQQPLPLRIVALEPDPKARDLLERKLGHKREILQVQALGALEFDATAEFAFVFSAFSGHHIKGEERKPYFSKIVAVLKPRGFLIVGDEFLPLHAEGDRLGYEKALRAYHGYIIDEARKTHCTEVAELEEAALQSGLPDNPQRIDFKVTAQEYVRAAQEAGLLLLKDECVSPSALSDTVGGIHVMVLQKPAA
jgi:SAM-dependent methyltransferase